MLLRPRPPASTTPPRRSRSRRRVALLVALLAVLGLTWLLRTQGIAGFNGTPSEQMDWDGDGQVTWPEILQGFYAVSVQETREGVRTCRRYAFLRTPDAAIRVDCRVDFGTAAPP